MKNGKRLIKKALEAEASVLEEQGKNRVMDIPADAKKPEELLEELVDKFRSGIKI